MKKNKKENLILLIGIILIGFVFLITFVRSGIKKKDDSLDVKIDIPVDYPITYPKDLSDKIQQKSNLQILDLRSQSDFEEEHIMNSINIPQENLQKEGDILDPAKETILITYTDSKEAVSNAVKLLENNGFADVSVLYNGMEGWKAGLFNTVTNGDPTSILDQSKVIYISPEEFQTISNKNSTLFVLDVRDPSEFAKESIHNSINIPFEKLESRKDEISKFKEIVVYGKDAIESFRAGSKLFDLGFFTTKTLDGGFDTWKEFVSKNLTPEKSDSDTEKQTSSVEK